MQFSSSWNGVFRLFRILSQLCISHFGVPIPVKNNLLWLLAIVSILQVPAKENEGKYELPRFSFRFSSARKSWNLDGEQPCPISANEAVAAVKKILVPKDEHMRFFATALIPQGIVREIEPRSTSVFSENTCFYWIVEVSDVPYWTLVKVEPETYVVFFNGDVMKVAGKDTLISIGKSTEKK